MNIFIIIINQIAIFALLMIIGFLSVKFKLLNETALDYFAKYIMKLALPLLIFINIIDQIKVKDLFNSISILLVILFIYLILLLVSYGSSKLFNVSIINKRLYSAIFSFGNIGFMGIPILTSLFPNTGMLYVMLFTIIDQSLLWTVGMYLTSSMEKTNNLSIKSVIKKFINPAIISISLGLIIVILGIKVPSIIHDVVEKIGSTATPLSLMYIGGLFYYIDIRKCIKKYELYGVVVIKMIILPCIIYLLLKYFLFTMEEATALAILCSLPSMSSIAIFARLNGVDGEYAIGGLFITTISSVITIPIVGYFIENIFT